MYRSSFVALSYSLFLMACGGSNSTAETPDSSSEESVAAASSTEGEQDESESEESSGPTTIPTTCYESGSLCTPDPQWVKKLCADVYPAVALHLFQKSSPFTHGYISARKVKAVNASGGPTSGEEWLQFDEEVVLLYHRTTAAGGMQVSGAGEGYEAMRLDGSCVTLGGDEVRTHEPPSPKYVKVPWRFIGKDMQNHLRSLPSIKEHYIARRTECQGAFSGTVTDKCLKKDKVLNRAIIDTLKSGEANLPQPNERP